MSQRPIHHCSVRSVSRLLHADKEDHHRMNVLQSAQRTASTLVRSVGSRTSGMRTWAERYERQHDSAVKRRLSSRAGRPTLEKKVQI